MRRLHQLICQIIRLHRLLPVHFLKLLVDYRSRLREEESLSILKFLLISDCVFHRGQIVLVDKHLSLRDLLRLFLVYLYLLVFGNVVLEVVEEIGGFIGVCARFHVTYGDSF